MEEFLLQCVIQCTGLGQKVPDLGYSWSVPLCLISRGYVCILLHVKLTCCSSGLWHQV